MKGNCQNSSLSPSLAETKKSMINDDTAIFMNKDEVCADHQLTPDVNTLVR